MSRAAALRSLSPASGIAIVGIVLTVDSKAQTAAADQPAEKIEVTGSHIKRAEAESAENIQIITSQDIQRSGQPTVADYLRNISANFAAFNETFVNSFAPGAAGLALRGLSQKNTLVLLNGRRIANYGFAQNVFAIASALKRSLYGEYRGLKNWSFRLSVTNLFNGAPPFDDAALFVSGYEQYDQTLYDPRGRVVDLHVQYTF